MASWELNILTLNFTKMSKKEQNLKSNTERPIGYEPVLSAGICDTCTVPKMINTGDGKNDPSNPELYCELKKIFIEPLHPDDRIKQCKFYTCK